MNRKAGFTLIELLVVIAITAILLSIIVPSMRLAKEKARNIICRSNLHQYALAAEMYLNENDELYPDARTYLLKTLPSGFCQWHDEANFLDSRPDLAGPLWPYLDTAGVHLCPTFYSVGKRYGPLNPFHSSGIPFEPQYSYSMNLFLGQTPGVKKRTEVKFPTTTFSFGEENMWVTTGLNGCILNDNAITVHSITSWPDTLPPFEDSLGFFHNSPNLDRFVEMDWSQLEDIKNIGNTNAVFVDGHTESVKPQDSYRLAVPSP